MDPFTLLALLVTLTALLSFLNVRFVGLPPTIGVAATALVLSLALVALGERSPAVLAEAQRLVATLDFGAFVFHGVLSSLLFAGALGVDARRVVEQRWAVLALATLGVVLSAAAVGGLAYLVLGWIGVAVPFGYALVFGALISPTDPAAVLSVLRSAGVPPRLEATIAGESLFNDGVGVVLFIVALGAATGSTPPTVDSVSLLLLREAGGGLALGAALGAAAYWMLGQIDDQTTEVLLTLAVVTGGYALAEALGVSGPLAMVVAGLAVGSVGRERAMSAATRRVMDGFWALAEQILNGVLFVVMGLEVLVIAYTRADLAAGLLMIPVVLVARAVSVVGAAVVLRRFDRGVVEVMTWGGLRGGIAVALALALPAGPERRILVAATYTVVVFSVLVQGTTTGRLARRVLSKTT